MCLEIAKSGDAYENIDIEKFSNTMNVLNKKGFSMKDSKKSHKKKILGAVISSLVFSLFFIFLIGLISYFQITENEKIPWLVYMFLIVLFGFPILSVAVNLFRRIKEIKGGEEDEASKY